MFLTLCTSDLSNWNKTKMLFSSYISIFSGRRLFPLVIFYPSSIIMLILTAIRPKCYLYVVAGLEEIGAYHSEGQERVANSANLAAYVDYAEEAENPKEGLGLYGSGPRVGSCHSWN